MDHSPYIIVKGEAACLSRGFDRLRKDTCTMTIKTIEYEKKRQFKLVEVEQYDPVFQQYEKFGTYYADAVTGTLYDPKTGVCLSSSQIQLMV